MAKDYYEILGVSKDATKEDVKKAYKRLAKKHHPDINKEEGSSEKFKGINEAAAILGDDKKRANYDRFGTAEETFGQGGFDFRDFTEGAGQGGFDFGDIFDQFFGGGSSFFGGRTSRRGGPQRGADLRFEMDITLEDTAFGVEKQVTIPKLETCDVCDGKGAENASDITTCSECGGSGMSIHQQRTPFGIFQTSRTCRTCRGAGKEIKKLCKKCRGAGRVEIRKKLDIKIPAGVDTGVRVRVAGEGEAGVKGGPPGDLYIVIHIKPHKVFERSGNDLYIEIPISYTQAALGTEIKIPTIEGEATLKIHAGTQSETIFRMRGKGIPHLNRGGAGDQMVKVSVDVPKNLNSKQKQLLKDFEKLTGSPQKSFFDKVKDAIRK